MSGDGTTAAAGAGPAPYRTMAGLFTDEPARWGLRGDPFAWAAIRDHLGQKPVPGDPADTERLLRDGFRAVVGVALDDPTAADSVYVAEFAHGGMSSGLVDLPTWREVLVPLLLARARVDP